MTNYNQVSRSRRFSAATDLGYIYMYLSHCLCATVPQDVGEKVTQYEEIVQPKYAYYFEIIEMDEEDMTDMA